MKNKIFPFEVLFSRKSASKILGGLFKRATAKRTRIHRIFEADFLENKASNGKILFFIFDLIFYVESFFVLLYIRNDFQ